MEDKSAIEQFNLTRQVELCLTIRQYLMEHNKATVAEACSTVDVPVRTFYQWLNDGVLDEYFSEFSGAMARIGRTTVLDRWESVIDNMVAIASGTKVIKGANPVSAAEFLRKVAGIAYAIDETPAVNVDQMNVFMLPQAMAIVREGKPQLVEDIVDAEFEED